MKSGTEKASDHDSNRNHDVFERKFLEWPIRCRLEGFSEWIFDERLLSWKIHAPSWKI